MLVVVPWRLRQTTERKWREEKKRRLSCQIEISKREKNSQRNKWTEEGGKKGRTRKENRKYIRKSLSLFTVHTLHTHSVSMDGKRESCIERHCQSLEICSLERRTVSVNDITTHMESKEVSFYLSALLKVFFSLHSFFFTLRHLWFRMILPLCEPPPLVIMNHRLGKRYLESGTESYCFIRHIDRQRFMQIKWKERLNIEQERGWRGRQSAKTHFISDSSCKDKPSNFSYHSHLEKRLFHWMATN